VVDRQFMLTIVSAATDLDDAVSGVDPDVALRAVARLRRLVEQLEAEQVAAARRAGWSWQDIAVRLGVTKQTVHRKHRRSRED
jgi:DNA-directed RNA polymerase specialized sigma24 family protein